MYKIKVAKSNRKLPIFSRSPRVIYWSIIPITSHLFKWAVGAKIRKRLDRLPFQVCPQIFIIPDTSKFVKQKRTQQHRHIHYIIASSQTVLTYAGRSRCAASFSGAFSHEKCSPKWNARLLHKMRRAFLWFQTKNPGSSWLFLRLMLQ
mgnify:CR=1 FL=1